ncbi:hypothetical protein JAAARDRAFT_142595 [Jaapia argillacea MUCL 33604]|uniref:G-protein coupled receptors family 1 profile domain-containing protein n=1 Tax=Jaapia argillacea MUCL 33604 TaxID=933084 RepID=A0A067PHR8_9AGAM|nr:hypothetical protein JAAARDRAFT_142595 [Jaapia argillacea MUCL 33604]
MINSVVGGGGSSRMMFPSTGMQILSSIIHLLGVSIIAHCLSRRIAIENLTTMDGFRQISWPRLCIILVFLDSWLFVFMGGLLIFGAGVELHPLACSLGVDICIAFYATSKIFIYCFLMEKVYIVWAPPTGVAGRFKSPIYNCCIVAVSMYSVVVAIAVIGATSFFRNDGACVIGLRRYASASLLGYDLFINLFLTSMFLWPLFRYKFANAALRKVASRTLFAALMALSTSTLNILVLTIMHGQQLAWVCLGSCGTDVVLNALVLFWVTGGAGAASDDSAPTGAVNHFTSCIRFPTVKTDIGFDPAIARDTTTVC